MVRKNYKWNISKVDGEKLINEKIRDILENKGEMEITELKFILQNRTIDIKIQNNNKKKNIINFIKNVFGGLKNFIENRKDLYTIEEKEKGNGIKFLVDINKNKEDIFFLNDWIIIE